MFYVLQSTWNATMFSFLLFVWFIIDVAQSNRIHNNRYNVISNIWYWHLFFLFLIAIKQLTHTTMCGSQIIIWLIGAYGYTVTRFQHLKIIIKTVHAKHNQSKTMENTQCSQFIAGKVHRKYEFISLTHWNKIYNI